MTDLNLIDMENWGEHYIRRGDPTKPTYYIIRRYDRAAGLFSYFDVVKGHIAYALSNGWLPVVDMQNYPNPYLAPEKLGKENAWEYYFEQPMRIGLETAYDGENIILSYGTVLQQCLGNGTHSYKLTEWRMLVKLGLLKVKPAIYEEASSLFKKLFSPGERVLGVLLRGTDYVARRPYGHDIPPPIEFAASTVVRKLIDWNCAKFFLATEDKNIVETFKQVFGEMCAVLDRQYVDYNPQTDKSVAMSRIDRENDHFLQGKDYLMQILLLTMCNSLVATVTCGTNGAQLLPNNFEQTYLFNLGKYGMITLD